MWEEGDKPLPESRRRIEELRTLLDLFASSYSYSRPPGEAVFALIKEVLYYSASFFRFEHIDVRVRNPDIAIVYRPTSFRGADGQRKIDTGLPSSIKKYTVRPRLRTEELLSEYLSDLIQDIIELEKSYISKSSFSAKRRVRPKSDSVQPRLPVRKNNSLLKRINALERQVAYLRRKLKLSFTKGPQKKSPNKNQ
jgi:hypothetical protein